MPAQCFVRGAKPTSYSSNIIRNVQVVAQFHLLILASMFNEFKQLCLAVATNFRMNVTEFMIKKEKYHK